MAGVPLPTVQQILGHRDIQTTLRYSHLAPSHIQAAMDKGSLVHLGFGTGSGLEERKKDRTQVVDKHGAPDKRKFELFIQNSRRMEPHSARNFHRNFLNTDNRDKQKITLVRLFCSCYTNLDNLAIYGDRHGMETC